MILSKIQQDKIKNHFKLSNREIEIVTLFFNGIDKNKEISKMLNVYERTTKGYVQRIFLKTGARTKLRVVVKCLSIFELT